MLMDVQIILLMVLLSSIPSYSFTYYQPQRPLSKSVRPLSSFGSTRHRYADGDGGGEAIHDGDGRSNEKDMANISVMINNC